MPGSRVGGNIWNPADRDDACAPCTWELVICEGARREADAEDTDTDAPTFPVTALLWLAIRFVSLCSLTALAESAAYTGRERATSNATESDFFRRDCFVCIKIAEEEWKGMPWILS